MVADAQRGDPTALEALQLITGKEILDPPTDVDNWTVETDSHRSVLFYKGKIYIPDNLELRWLIVKQFHDVPTAGHPGILGTFQELSIEYYWPGMRTFVRNYVQGCAHCQQFKINR